MMDMKACYDTLRERKEKFGGLYFFTEPIFMPVDIDLIKNIMSKDFAHFQGHGFTFNEKYDPLSAHLFNLEGEKWKNMRVKLSPTFTSGKMKYMFKTLLDCGGPMIDHLNGICEKKEEVDIKEILACYTTDIIGSCAFGLECNSFKDPDAEFRTNGQTLRKYPPVPILNRVCSSDYKIPNTDIILPTGTKVFISSLGIHRNEEYYPDPMKFDPERFTDENKASRSNYTWMPFAEGPRICIGLRFGLMQAKTGLSMLLNNYRILPGKNETYDMEIDPQNFVLSKNGTVMLRLEKLST
ncbi:cytochrome p450 [Holotrichia oblita]|uniref:Cytochrome p450 n=1 Tax=Holotrichia oblita TaxID=644536 RepID=A0ACB9SXT4_HOLOL|nr:cytochrome p450 [Holotrichia oblita]